MSAPANSTHETKAQGRAMAFINLIAVLGVLVTGYPLAPATIRTMLITWILIVVGITKFILGHRFQPIGSASTLRPVHVRSTDSERIR